MQTRYILAALSYFSIFFAGVLVPLIIWLVANDRYVKKHASQALFSHMIPYALLVIVIFSLFSLRWMTSLWLMILLWLIIIALFVWNVVMGIKVLMESR